MKDIAQKAGVSVITVSRAINKPDTVKDETREKIFKIMKEMDFHPNQAAKALVSNKTRTIHVMIPRALVTYDPYIMRFIAGVSDELSQAYYSFLIRRDWDFPYKCDGVIVMGLDKGEDSYLVDKLNVPSVLFGQTDLKLDWVDVDNKKGAYLMTKHLIDYGHEKIGFIAVDEDKRFASERLQGYYEALQDHDLIPNEQFVKFAINEEKYGYEKGLELLKNTDITAIFCSTDVLALGAIRAARSLQKKVPEEISVAGFDGVSVDEMADPPLTTIRQPVYDVGRLLAKKLIRRIDNINATVVNELIEPDLIIRKSIKNNK